MAGQPFGVFQGMHTEPGRILEEMKRLAVEQLGALPAGLGRAVEQTLQASPGGPSFEEQNALQLLRQQSAGHVMRFREQIAKGFDDFRGPSDRAGHHMGLVEEQVLDFHLAGQRLSVLLEQRYQRPLEVMKERLGALSNVMRLPAASNPIAPARLVGAFVQTYGDLKLPEALSDLMFRQYQLALGRVLDDLYVRINSLLAGAGYGSDVQGRRATPLPSSRSWAQPEEVLAPAAGPSAAVPNPFMPAARPPAAPTLPPMPVVSSRLSAELSGLRAQLHAWRNQASSEQSPADLSKRRELQTQEVVTIASVLQGEAPDTYARALAGPGRLGECIRDQLNSGARRLGMSPDQIRLGQPEEDAIDMVAMLFESVFRTHSLQDRARRLYGRLVLPYVKVALASDAMFVQPQHPARRLLDAVTEACEDNDASTPQDRELLERAAAVSQRVVAEYNEDIAIFETAHAELEELLIQQRRRGELQESRAAKATYGRERLAQARGQADELLRARLSTRPLTAAVAEFLTAPWRHHLVQTLLREGDGSERANEAIDLGVALVEADAMAEAGRGRELAERMFSLQPLIVQCLASLGLDEGAGRHGMAMLLRDLARPDCERRTHSAAPLASDEPANDDPRLWLAGGTATVPHDPAIAATIRRLRPGEWMRLLDAQGEATSVKVAWVSPLTSRLLLVNRRGMRVLVSAPEELAAMVGAGRLVLGGERTPFSEAMVQLRQRLDHAVGQC